MVANIVLNHQATFNILSHDRPCSGDVAVRVANFAVFAKGAGALDLGFQFAVARKPLELDIGKTATHRTHTFAFPPFIKRQANSFRSFT